MSFDIGAAGTSLVRVTSAGKVGIGLTSPRAKLSLDTNGSLFATNIMANGSISAASYSGFYHNDMLIGNFVDAAAYAQTAVSFGYTGDGRKFNIGSANNAAFDATTTFVPGIVLNSSGQVGIDGTQPVSGYSIATQGIIYSNAAGTDITPTLAAWAGQYTMKGSGYSGGLAMDASGMWIGHNSTNRSLIFAMGAAEYARLSNAGNFTIASQSGQSVQSFRIDNPTQSSIQCWGGSYYCNMTQYASGPGYMQSSGTALYVGTTGSGNLQLYTNGTTALTINSSGGIYTPAGNYFQPP